MQFACAVIPTDADAAEIIAVTGRGNEGGELVRRGRRRHVTAGYVAAGATCRGVDADPNGTVADSGASLIEPSGETGSGLSRRSRHYLAVEPGPSTTASS